MIVHGDKKDPIPVVETEANLTRSNSTAANNNVVSNLRGKMESESTSVKLYVNDRKEELHDIINVKHDGTRNIIKNEVSGLEGRLKAKIDDLRDEEVFRGLDRMVCLNEGPAQLVSSDSVNGGYEANNSALHADIDLLPGTRRLYSVAQEDTGTWKSVFTAYNTSGIFYACTIPPVLDWNSGAGSQAGIRITLDGYVKEFYEEDMIENRMLAAGHFMGGQPYTDNESTFRFLNVGEVTNPNAGFRFYNHMIVEVLFRKPRQGFCVMVQRLYT